MSKNLLGFLKWLRKRKGEAQHDTLSLKMTSHISDIINRVALIRKDLQGGNGHAMPHIDELLDHDKE